MSGYAYAAGGMILAGFAVYAADVWRCRRRDRQPPSVAVPMADVSGLIESPAHDAIRLEDDEEDRFVDLIITYFEREATP